MIPELPHADPEEWAALYMSGAMTPTERAALEALLSEECLAFDAELKRLDPVLTALARAVPPVNPSAAAKAALINRIAADKAPRPAHKESLPSGIFLQQASEDLWKPTRVPGVHIRLMYVDHQRERVTACLRMAAGFHYPGHVHEGVEELYVLEGDLHVGDVVLRAGDYQRSETDTHHEDQFTEAGCTVLVSLPLAALKQ